MITNYNSFSRGDCFEKKERKMEGVAHATTGGSPFKSLLMLIMLFAGVFNINAQALSGTNQGGFEVTPGSDNQYGWTLVNSSSNFWVIGSGATASNGSNSIYITNNSTTKPYAYTTTVVTPTYSWFYRDITVPIGQTIAGISYKWKNQGESSNDQIKVYASPTNVTPVADAPMTSFQVTDLSVATVAQTSYQTVAATALPATLTKSGSTFRLIFGWTNNTTLGGPNPASIDEINVIFTTPVSKTALSSGGWGDENMWATTASSLTGTITTTLTAKSVTGVGTAFKSQIGVGSNLYLSDGTTLIGTVASISSDTSLSLTNNAFVVATAAAFTGKIAPLATDNVTIPTGISVTHNILSSATSGVNITVNNLTINSGGSLRLNNGVTSGGNFTCTGDLTVNTTGTLENHYGKTLTVGGNVVNDGTINLSLTASIFTLNGWQPQTVSGAGDFGYSTSDSNAYKVIKSALNFSNQSTFYPNITWNLDNIVLSGTITLNNSTMQRVDMGTRRIFIGYSKDVNTKSGNITTPSFICGFYPGAKISKYFAAANLGSAFTTSVTEGSGRFPFITATGDSRHVYLGRSAVNATEGDLEVTYTHDGTTSDLSPSIADGSYTIDKRYNGHWSIAANNGLTSDTFDIGTDAYNGLYVNNVANLRVIHQNAALGGTHLGGYSSLSGGSMNTFAIRKGVTQSDLTGSDIYMGIGNNDTYTIYSTATGDWSSPETWNTNTVPTTADRVLISAGTEVFAYDNGNGDNQAASIFIAAGGKLTFPAPGNLTVGTTHNNSLINSGTFKMNDGNLYLNGYFQNNSGATFIQTSGTIEIDGNDGNVATSVPTGTPLCKINFTPATIQIGGGTMTIKNPHIGTSSSDYSLLFNNTGLSVPYGAPTTHTVQFGKAGYNSTIGANYPQGFHFSGSGTSPFYFGTVIVNSSNNTPSRCVGGTNAGNTIVYDLNILSGGEYRNNANLYVMHTLTNNGTFTNSGSSSLIAMAAYGSSIAPSVYSGSKITGGGLFRNNDVTSLATANIVDLTINNTQGVTLETPLTMNGILTLTNGLLTTSDTNLLTLGNAAANLPSKANAVGTSSASAASFVNGPLARVYPQAALNSNYYQFPVGKGSTYAPIWVAPSTTGLATFKVSYDNISGGAGSGCTYTAANGKWNVLPDNSSNIANMNVKLQIMNGATNTFIDASNVPVASDSLTGTYSNVFGDTVTYASNTIQSNVPAAYKQYISYAVPLACSGTPAPGNTIASATSFCAGDSIALSLQNATPGSGVTYQWQNSTDGSAYANITGATAAILTVKPTASFYYRCNVTCSSVIGSSTPVLINSANSVTSTTAPNRCGYGTVTLQGTANSGATLAWYNTANVGAIGEGLLGTGDSFTTTTPINANTSYYAAAETSGTGVYTVFPMPSGVTYSNSNASAAVSVTKPLTVNSFDFIPTSTTPVYFVLATTTDGVNSGTILNTYLYTPTFIQVSAGLPITVPVNFSLATGTTYLIYTSQDATSSNGLRSASVNRLSVSPTPYPIISNGFKFTGGASSTSVSFWNWKINGDIVCSSARIPVQATVTASPTLSLSTSTTAICLNATSAPVTITNNDGNYDSFSWTPSTGVNDAVNGWTFNPTVTTTYTLWATQSSGSCGATATVTVTVNPLPNAFSITASPNIICASATTPVSVKSSYNNVPPTAWWAPASQILRPATPFTPTCNGTLNTVATSGINNDSNTYSVINVSANTKYTFSAELTFIYLVVMDATGTIPLAGGIGTVDYFSNTNGQVRLYSYDNIQGGNTNLNQYKKFVTCSSLPVPTWSPVTNLYSDAAGTTPYMTGTQTSTVYALPAATATYKATMTTALGCSSEVTTTITVNPLPEVSAPSQVCVGSTIALSPTTGGTWASSDTSKATVTSTGVVSGVAAGNVTFAFTNTTSGCSATTTPVTVNALPTVSAPSQVCVDSTISLSPAIGGTWTSSDTSIASVTDSGVITGEVAGSATFTFTDATTGCSATTTSVTVNSLPSVNPITGNTNVAIDSTTLLASTTSAGDWSSSDITVATVDSNGLVTGHKEGTSTISYRVTINGCSAAATTQVTVSSSLGNEQFDLSKLSYYPNPIKDILNISYVANIKTVSVYNLLGQELTTEAINANLAKIDMSALPNAAYMIKINLDDNLIKTIKVIKQ